MNFLINYERLHTFVIQEAYKFFQQLVHNRLKNSQSATITFSNADNTTCKSSANRAKRDATQNITHLINLAEKYCSYIKLYIVFLQLLVLQHSEASKLLLQFSSAYRYKQLKLQLNSHQETTQNSDLQRILINPKNKADIQARIPHSQYASLSQTTKFLRQPIYKFIFGLQLNKICYFMSSLDPQEMLRYFSDFLTEINLIISNIKQHTYEFVSVSIPNTTILKVYDSMASIIASTHKTYDDLKRIESVMNGIIKARRIIDRQQPQTPLIARMRCRSQDGNLSQREQKYKDAGKQSGMAEQPNKSSQIKTIKRGDTSKQFQLEISSVVGKELPNKKQAEEEGVKEQDKMTVKYVTDRGSQSSSDRGKPLLHMKKWLQERIERIVASNRVGVTKIINSNSQCLRLVRSAKKEVVSK